MEYKQYNGPMRIAHRGVVQAAPENTLPAFEAAKNMGLEGVEIDVQLSRDGQVVVIHDANLTRLTLGHPTLFTHAEVGHLTWEELSRLELPYANHLLDEEPPEGSENELLAIRPARILGQESGKGYLEALKQEPRNAKLMLFSDFLTWLETAPGMLAEIEIKSAGVALPVFRILEGSPASDRCIVFSGNSSYIWDIRQAAAQGIPKGVRLGANIRCLTPQAKELVKSMKPWEVGLNAGCIRPEDVAWLADRGVSVFANLGDYPLWWAEMCSLGIAGFKTNYAKAYTRWWMEQNFSLSK